MGFFSQVIAESRRTPSFASAQEASSPMAGQTLGYDQAESSSADASLASQGNLPLSTTRAAPLTQRTESSVLENSSSLPLPEQAPRQAHTESTSENLRPVTKTKISAKQNFSNNTQATPGSKKTVHLSQPNNISEFGKQEDPQGHLEIQSSDELKSENRTNKIQKSLKHVGEDNIVAAKPRPKAVNDSNQSNTKIASTKMLDPVASASKTPKQNLSNDSVSSPSPEQTAIVKGEYQSAKQSEVAESRITKNLNSPIYNNRKETPTQAKQPQVRIGQVNVIVESSRPAPQNTTKKQHHYNPDSRLFLRGP